MEKKEENRGIFYSESKEWIPKILTVCAFGCGFVLPFFGGHNQMLFYALIVVFCTIGSFINRSLFTFLHIALVGGAGGFMFGIIGKSIGIHF